MKTDGKAGNRAANGEISASRRRLFNEIASRYELLNTLMSAHPAVRMETPTI